MEGSRYELVFFDGELLFHNGRSLCPKARFHDYESEIDVFQAIVANRKGKLKFIYDSLFDCLLNDENDINELKSLPIKDQVQTLYDYSMKSWQFDTSEIHAFTLLNVNDKMYNLLSRFGYIGSYYRGLDLNEGEVKEFTKIKDSFQ